MSRGLRFAVKRQKCPRSQRLILHLKTPNFATRMHLFAIRRFEVLENSPTQVSTNRSLPCKRRGLPRQTIRAIDQWRKVSNPVCCRIRHRQPLSGRVSCNRYRRDSAPQRGMSLRTLRRESGAGNDSIWTQRYQSTIRAMRSRTLVSPSELHRQW